MADEKTPINKDLEETSDVKEKSMGLKAKLIIIPAILIIQAVAAYFLVFNILIANPEKKQPEKKKETQVGQFFEITDFVINPAGSRGRRFLVLELNLETHDAKLMEEAESKRVWLRDAILLHLVKKTSDELLDFTKRDCLKVEILEVINSKLSKGTFDELYFNKYIMQ